MQKNAVKAATYKRANSDSNLSWVPEKTDVILSKRETRSSKPEVVYRLSAVASEPVEKWDGSTASTSPSIPSPLLLFPSPFLSSPLPPSP